MNNILWVGKGILERCETYDIHPIYNLIRMISDSYTNKYMMDFLSQNSDNFVDNSIRLSKMFFKKIVLDDKRLAINTIIYKNKITASTNIDFALDSVIASPWGRSKFIKSICTTGDGLINGRWNNESQNSSLILPIGVVILHDGGNHSISIALSKHAGKFNCNDIYSIDYLYDYIYFDGTNYRDIKSDYILAKNCSFEYGVIFELGRLIREYKVNYKNIQLY